MGQFSASLKVPGERSSLAATLHVEDGRLKIVAGNQDIGDWSLEEIDLNRLAGAYRMTAEGEQLLIELQDLAGFGAAVENQRPQRRGWRKPKTAKVKTAKSIPLVAGATGTGTTNVKPERRPKEGPTFGSRVIEVTDNLIDSAERRFGDLAPPWIFSRATVMVLVILLLITIFFPGLISALLLISGLVVVVFGAVLYTDDRSATRMLPGRMTPIHVLILGVGLLLLGVLVGVIAP